MNCRFSPEQAVKAAQLARQCLRQNGRPDLLDHWINNLNLEINVYEAELAPAALLSKRAIVEIREPAGEFSQRAQWLYQVSYYVPPNTIREPANAWINIVREGEPWGSVRGIPVGEIASRTLFDLQTLAETIIDK